MSPTSPCLPCLHTTKHTALISSTYSFYEISEEVQQIAVRGIGRVDAFIDGVIYELKNYNWGNYSASQIRSLSTDFVSQAENYKRIGILNGSSVKGIVFYFCS